MPTSSLTTIGLKTSRYTAIILGAIASCIIYCIPLQHYMTLGRYQHYGLSIFAFGMGYILQTIWSWRSLTKWVRISYLMTGFFFCSVGCVFWENTWLDYKIAVQTEDREHQRNYLIVGYLLFALSIVGIWAKCVKEESRAKVKPEENGKLAGDDRAV